MVDARGGNANDRAVLPAQPLQDGRALGLLERSTPVTELHEQIRTSTPLRVRSQRSARQGRFEQALASHPDVAECAVIGVKDALKTQLPLGLVVLKASVQREYSTIRNELIDLVRDQVGAVASFRHVAIVQRLPKTRSGKILRSTMRRIADADPYEIPATIDDPAIPEEIRTELRHLGYADGA
jgi:propionyl-CoA synthetase